MVAIRQFHILVGDLIHPAVVTLAVAAQSKDRESGTPNDSTNIRLDEGVPLKLLLTQRPANCRRAAR